jgi:hypothetical protein
MVVVSIAKFGVRRAKQNFAHLGVSFLRPEAVAKVPHHGVSIRTLARSFGNPYVEA